MNTGKILAAVRCKGIITKVNLRNSPRLNHYMTIRAEVTRSWEIFVPSDVFRLSAENLRFKMSPQHRENLIHGEYTIADFERVRDWYLGKQCTLRWTLRERNNEGNKQSLTRWSGELLEIHLNE